MKKIICCVLSSIVLSSGHAFATNETSAETPAKKGAEVKVAVPKDRKAEWFTDTEKAKIEANKYGLPILLLYTAPAWCGYCKKLETDLLDKKEFEKYANQNLVLLIGDYSDRAEGDKWAEKNKALLEACPVKGFPHMYLLSSDAKNLGSVQYYEPEWSAQDYMDKMEELKTKAASK